MWVLQKVFTCSRGKKVDTLSVYLLSGKCKKMNSTALSIQHFHDSLVLRSSLKPKEEIKPVQSNSPSYTSIKIKIKPTRELNKEPVQQLPDQSKNVGSSKFNSANKYFLPIISQINGASKLNVLRNGNKKSPLEVQQPKWLTKEKNNVSKASIDNRTCYLLQGLSSQSEAILLRRLEDLCHHLYDYPQTKGTAVKSGGIGCLLRLVARSKDPSVQHRGRTALALMGYPGPVRGRGIRILTIDGGGTRGLVAVELIRKLEMITGKPVHELFDLVCGVSTGAIVAVLVGAHRQTPDECEKLYRNLSMKIFSQTTLKGATSLVMNSSYYDSATLNEILQMNMGHLPLMDLENNKLHPKLCLVASQAEQSLTQAFLFRNYNLPYRVVSHYSGTSKAKLWEAVRASTAAPGYFSEFHLGDKVLQDGGILVNNPTAIAVHEARLLWPDTPFQSVVSLGTGRSMSVEEQSNSTSINWSKKLRSVINSATDTEGVHTVLHDLLPSNVYFRFNPALSDDYSLDEIRAERITAMLNETQLYIRRNQDKFAQVTGTLCKGKSIYHTTKDYLNYYKLLWGYH